MDTLRFTLGGRQWELLVDDEVVPPGTIVVGSVEEQMALVAGLVVAGALKLEGASGVTPNDERHPTTAHPQKLATAGNVAAAVANKSNELTHYQRVLLERRWGLNGETPWPTSRLVKEYKMPWPRLRTSIVAALDIAGVPHS